jgi:hypothetical protein
MGMNTKTSTQTRKAKRAAEPPIAAAKAHAERTIDMVDRRVRRTMRGRTAAGVGSALVAAGAAALVAAAAVVGRRRRTRRDMAMDTVSRGVARAMDAMRGLRRDVPAGASAGAAAIVRRIRR